MPNQIPADVRAFPSICACFGGAEWVRHSVGLVEIKLPGRLSPVRMKPTQLPEPSKWTAFNLADAAASFASQ